MQHIILKRSLNKLNTSKCKHQVTFITGMNKYTKINYQRMQLLKLGEIAYQSVLGYI